MKTLPFGLFFIPCCAFSQTYEITASYGSSSLTEFKNTLAESIGNAFVGEENAPNSKGMIAVGVYRYSESQKWRYGLDVTNEFFDSTTEIKKQNVLSVLPKVDYMWLKPETKFKIYSGVNLGFRVESYEFVNSENGQEEDKKFTKFAINVTPIGLRFGRDFGVFGELNFGSKGLFQGGVFYAF